MKTEPTEKKYIGVFDSGVGGLSILNKLIEDFPDESFVYLGDTARLPYGTKSKETIKNYVLRNIDFLTQNFSIKAIVVACNSASSVLSELKLPIKTIGVIEAGADAALSQTKTNSIGLWATRATVSSKAYEAELLKMDDEVYLNSVSCPSLVTMVEEAGSDHPLLPSAFNYYLEKFKDTPDMDTLILGCTHFPFFKNELTLHLKNLNWDLNLVDASEEISEQVRDLIAHDKTSKQTVGHHIMVTDDALNFKDFIKKHLPSGCAFEFHKVNL